MKSFIFISALLALSPQDEPVPPASRQVGEHSGTIARLAASPDGSVLVTAALGEVHAWDVKKERLLWKAKIADATIGALGVGKKLVAYHYGIAKIGFLHLEDGKHRTGVGGPKASQRAQGLAIDPRDRWVWFGNQKGGVTRVVPGSVNSWSYRNMANAGVTCVAMDGKGKTLAIGGRDATVRFVGAKSANRDDEKVFEGHPEAVSAIVMDSKGTLVVSGSEAGDIRVWKFSNGKQQHLLQEQGSVIMQLAVDPKGKYLASGDEDGVIQVWDLKRGAPRVTLPAPDEGAVSGLAFVGKGKTLAATWSSSKVTLWDLSHL